MLFRYLAARWRYRRLSAERYIRAGLALERRARALSVFWSEHLSRSRAAQSRWAQVCRGDVLTVLGAGPLFDFNSAAFVPRFNQFRLVDANPLSLQNWSRLNMPVEPVITDISGCLEKWCNAVKAFHGSWDQTLNAIRDLGVTPVPAYSPATDALLSLNILSQLEVGWQEAIESILQKRFGRVFVSAQEQQWLNAIRPASQALAEQHLAAMERSNAKYVLLIADTEYVDYTGPSYSRNRWAAAPVAWSGNWRADPGVQYEITPALEGLEMNRDTFARWLPSYRLEWQESWLWHIAPKGTEAAPRGSLHRVGAYCLRHCASV